MLLEPLRLIHSFFLVLAFLEILMPDKENPEQGVFLEQLMLTIGLPEEEAVPEMLLISTSLMVKEALSFPLQ
ncbi:hypothetical protein BD560DRAFT_396159 [Blakeslea trispora]|nr:hypothetical protein BD560DRAFT_396159 [Blakeslea trispora]